ncbi:MAG: hypothetical protein ABDH31_00075 [Chlorobiota bacterium]
MSWGQHLLRQGHQARLLPLPFPLALRLNSWGRRFLWRLLTSQSPQESFAPPPAFQRQLWGLSFRFPLFNAAGMFKYAEGYNWAYHQGAGAYLVGTTTSHPRPGLRWNGIRQPFMSYVRSRAALNALGLPNPGHAAVARILERLPRYPDFPVGASVALDPELPPSEALHLLREGMQLYVAAGVDFLELNESCPNVPHDPAWGSLEARLRWIAEHFLSCRERFVPVIVKVSVDLAPELLAALLELLLELGYDGLCIGNTSTAYEALLPAIAEQERPDFVAFWRRIGGGVSGAPIADRRRQLVRFATQWLAQRRPQREFYIIAAGGILSPSDLSSALADGASLAEWYTGYIFAYAEHGDRVYQWMASCLGAGSYEGSAMPSC